jgi:hypothetical protein
MSEINVPDYQLKSAFVTEKMNIRELARQVGNKRFNEIISSTSGLTMPQLVAARVAMQMLTLVDARRFCRVEPVPENGGMVYHFQYAAVPTNQGQTLSQGNDVNAVDLSLTDVYDTLVTKVARTDVSDIAARQTAINITNAIGSSHGNWLNYAMNTLIYAQAKAATTNVVQVGTAEDAKSTNFTFATIMALVGKVAGQRFRANTLMTYPYMAAGGTGGAETGFYPFINSNITNVQFTGALQDFVRTGNVPSVFGLELYLDQTFAPADNTPDGSALCAVCKSDESIGWAQADDIKAEMQRWAPQVGFRIVTSATGFAKLIVEPSVGYAKHAEAS